MTINKTFIQKYVSNDCEGRYWNWVDTNKTYEELKNDLANKSNGWFKAVRVVNKVFDEETFTITEEVVKKAERVYENYVWKKGAINEIIY